VISQECIYENFARVFIIREGTAAKAQLIRISMDRGDTKNKSLMRIVLADDCDPYFYFDVVIDESTFLDMRR
jgi:hypothetical protein